MDQDRLTELCAAYTANKINEDELEELLGHVHNPKAEPFLLLAIESVTGKIPTARSSESDKIRVYNQLISSSKYIAHRAPAQTMYQANFRRLVKFSVAAILLLSIGFSLYFVKRESSPEQRLYAGHASTGKLDMGSNKATLTLSNGTNIQINENSAGYIAQQLGANIIYQKGLLKYSGNNRPNEKATNTVTTPKGSSYSIILSDGTRVWLNTNSSITYPVAFSGNSRNVSISGEAYFEVSHDKSKPFTVQLPTATVQVLGTHFNLHAYAGEKMTTTLLAGSVRILNGTGSALIKPGQAATAVDKNGKISVREVDADGAVAWKKGYFSFANQNIKEVMTTIARWYDLDVEYEGDMEAKTFGGTIGRFQDLEKLLKSIQLTGVVHFKKEGRRIVVIAN